MKYYLTVLLCFSILSMFAQQLVPPIQNYSTVEYDGASQNWGIAVDETGIVYAANNEGLLVYDGQRWENYRLENGAVIRSVLPYKGKVYTGSYRDFGYWQETSTGRMVYKSLIPLLQDSLQSEEFWEILPYNNHIYFRSFGAIYKYGGGEVERVKQVVSNTMAVYKERLLIAVGKEGLFFLDGKEELVALPNQEILKGKRILDVEADGDSLLIGTRDQLYIFNGSAVVPYPHEELNEKLREFEFNHLLKSPEGDLLIATVRNGIIRLDRASGRITTYNRKNGLQNNTVLAMAQKKGILWLGLDNGIDAVDLDSSVEFYTDPTGEIGAVYDVQEYKNKLYVASNTGIYEIDSSEVRMIEGTQGHTWNLEVIDGLLYSNQNSGTYVFREGSFLPLDLRTGSFQIIESPRAGQLIIGDYTGLSILDLKKDTVLNVQGIDFPVRKMVMEDPTTFWLEHANEGVYRAGLSPDYQEEKFLSRVDSAGGKGHKSQVHLINGQVAVYRNNQWMKFNEFRDSLESFQELESFTNHELLLEDQNGYWFSNRTTDELIYTNFDGTEVKLAFPQLKRRLVQGNENLIAAADSTYYLTLMDGFAKIDLEKLIRDHQNQWVGKPVVRGIIGEEKRYNLDTSPSISFKNSRNLHILTGLPYSFNAGSLAYELFGEQHLTGVVENGILKFQNLPHGNYRLELTGTNLQGQSSETTVFDFEIQAPWYFSSWMQVVYILLLVGLVYLVYRLNRWKLQKHRSTVEERLEKEHQERVARLERKRLEDEIMMKRKELANSTMMAAKKNEVLMDIQGELNKDREKFSNQYRIKHIMNKINQAIKNKDEWQVFETNFKEIHEDFSRDLLEKFPKLTSKDLKLCSYLKMNLSSKEIAPLMGKSVRGVEVHRYRLRKKMNLKGEEHLSSYLIKNF